MANGTQNSSSALATIPESKAAIQSLLAAGDAIPAFEAELQRQLEAERSKLLRAVAKDIADAKGDIATVQRALDTYRTGRTDKPEKLQGQLTILAEIRVACEKDVNGIVASKGGEVLDLLAQQRAQAERARDRQAEQINRLARLLDEATKDGSSGGNGGTSVTHAAESNGGYFVVARDAEERLKTVESGQTALATTLEKVSTTFDEIAKRTTTTLSSITEQLGTINASIKNLVRKDEFTESQTHMGEQLDAILARLEPPDGSGAASRPPDKPGPQPAVVRNADTSSAGGATDSGARGATEQLADHSADKKVEADVAPDKKPPARKRSNARKRGKEGGGEEVAR